MNNDKQIKKKILDKYIVLINCKLLLNLFEKGIRKNTNSLNKGRLFNW